ncbi:MAG: GNAT family N-acetyltransferase [Cyclobacteriaceae bacterium]
MKLVPISRINQHLVEMFLSKAGNSLVSFRYFSTRPISVIDKHLVTYMILDDNGMPVCYGHLDEEDGVVWLGVAVISSKTGEGLGKKMIECLVEYGRLNKIKEIGLSVDANNVNAIRLYEHFGFEKVKKTGTISFFRKRISSV